MVVVPEAAHTGERQEALLREQAVQLELSHFQVHPGRIQQIVETNPAILEVERLSLGHGWQNRERDVLVEGSCRPDIQTRKVKSVRVYGLLSAGGGHCGIDGHFGPALQMPVRRDAESYGPIRWVLING